MKHKKTILAASLLAAALATTGVTLAFLTTSTEEVENVFSPTSVPIKVDETFDGKTKEDVRIQNTGTPENGTDAYIRAAVVKNWLNADDNSVVYLENDPYEFVDTKGAYFDLTDTDSQTGFSEWFYHGGYFYYVMRAKERIEVHALATCGTFSSWQRMTSRLCTHGPITPYLPSSMLQTKKTQVYISEELAAPFECWEKVGY